uniref:PDEase domain-containing protein n=1 Tax=Macrostomum lignano TaxID=282301 RepID=A0A1I8F7B5_9PLAT
MQSLSEIPEQFIGYLEGDDEWEFDIPRAGTGDQQPRPLRFNVCQLLQCSEDTMLNWLQVIQDNYHQENCYHNATHPRRADVMQSSAYFLERIRVKAALDEMDEAASLIGALVHDPGPSGQDQTPSSSTAGTGWLCCSNDVSVLESHHVSLAFQLNHPGRPRINIFKNLPPDEYKSLRQGIVDVVLATEMARHFEHVGKLWRLLLAGRDSGPSDEASSGIGNMARRGGKRWSCWPSRRTELSSCGCSSSAPTSATSAAALAQTVQGVVQAHFRRVLSAAFCDVPQLLDNMNNNYAYWKQLLPKRSHGGSGAATQKSKLKLRVLNSSSENFNELPKPKDPPTRRCLLVVRGHVPVRWGRSRKVSPQHAAAQFLIAPLRPSSAPTRTCGWRPHVGKPGRWSCGKCRLHLAHPVLGDGQRPQDRRRGREAAADGRRLLRRCCPRAIDSPSTARVLQQLLDHGVRSLWQGGWRRLRRRLLRHEAVDAGGGGVESRAVWGGGERRRCGGAAAAAAAELMPESPVLVAAAAVAGEKIGKGVETQRSGKKMEPGWQPASRGGARRWQRGRGGEQSKPKWSSSAAAAAAAAAAMAAAAPLPPPESRSRRSRRGNLADGVGDAGSRCGVPSSEVASTPRIWTAPVPIFPLKSPSAAGLQNLADLMTRVAALEQPLASAPRTDMRSCGRTSGRRTAPAAARHRRCA